MSKMLKWSVLALGLVVMVFVLALGILAGRYEMLPAVDYSQKFDSDKEVIDKIESLLSVDLPDSVTSPRLYKGKGRDPTLWMAFKLTKADLARFKKELGLEWKALEDTLPRTPPVEISSWWYTSGRRGLLVGKQHSEHGGAGRWWILDSKSRRVFVCDYRS